MKLVNERNRIIDWTKKQLIGFDFKDNILVGQRPLDRFVTGFLYPISNSEDGIKSSEDEIDEYGGNDEEENSDAQLVSKRKRYTPPSSAGISFYITGNNIKLRVFYNGVYYLAKEKISYGHVKTWERNKFSSDGEEVEFKPDGNSQYEIFNKNARIDAIWRKYKSGYLVTISISNRQNYLQTDNSKENYINENEKTLFEVEFKCIIENGKIADYPSKDKSMLNEEEKEIELRYKNIKTYAIGHGVAVDWGLNSENKMEIWSDFMPTIEVPQVTADTSKIKDKTLEFSFLETCISDNVVFEKLEDFINNYSDWIVKQNEVVDSEDDEEIETAKNIVKKQEIAAARMWDGLELLKNDSKARESFSIMNQVMLKQWISSDNIKGKIKPSSDYKWRPFQLAFILLAVDSVVDENSEFRDVLDLIWFPTGGGKTEAYLGLMSFLFIFRRLRYPASSSGTVTIMRYTLRLLTIQQFLRANRVIFALELIRQNNIQKLGTEPFSTGLWLGSGSSPNTFKKAKSTIEEDKYENFPINSCPWCEKALSKENYISNNDKFYLTCTNPKCEFGVDKSILPCNFVDEALYKNPPTLLLATVDKFARLTWEERASTFFGIKGIRPPELIIQDELHLIASSLGSIVGLYEAGIDTALISKGIHPKYIASTATIKNAKAQVQALFARDMAIFPSPGLRYDDSYFSKTIPLDEKPGRLYVGYLAPLISKQQSLEPLAGTLMAAPTVLFKDQEEFLDNWWTQIIYHGSLKGVGNSRTLYQSGIVSKLRNSIKENLIIEIEEFKPGFISDREFNEIEDFQKIEDPEIKSIVSKYFPIRDTNVKLLTSMQPAKENTKVFNLLAKEKHEANSVDVALATNMISVGLDVPRLALMIINGQPLQTAEYIQASSRIGRGETPGIVFINYYKTQARSLSHYENFKAYHSSFYRYVEPSSITPYTYLARMRALHAALIIAIRHGHEGLLANHTAGDFNYNNESIKKIISEFKQRCKNAQNWKIEDYQKVEKHIDLLVNSWKIEVDSLGGKRDLEYHSKDNGKNNLICNIDATNTHSDTPPWPTLNSMRNVENEALIKLLKGFKKYEN